MSWRVCAIRVFPASTITSPSITVPIWCSTTSTARILKLSSIGLQACFVPRMSSTGCCNSAISSSTCTHNQQPIVFRDLKPNNIILTPEGEIVLIDFGIAKRLQQTGAMDTTVGTQGYASPEMYEGRAERRSDIFALGAMMHYLLTKQDPRLRAPFSFHEHPIRHYNPAVSAELDAVVMKCVQQPIDKRYQSIAELRAALEPSIGIAPPVRGRRAATGGS